jgi:hypothetical protein
MQVDRVSAQEFVLRHDFLVAAPIQFKHSGVGIKSRPVGPPQIGVFHDTAHCLRHEVGVLSSKEVQSRTHRLHHLVQIISTQFRILFVSDKDVANQLFSGSLVFGFNLGIDGFVRLLQLGSGKINAGLELLLLPC